MAYYRDNPSGLGAAMPRPAVIRPAMPSPAVTAYAASVTAPAKRTQLVIGTGSGCDLTASGSAVVTDALREQDLRRVTGVPAGVAIIIRRSGFAPIAEETQPSAIEAEDRATVARMLAGGDLLVRDFNNILLAPTISGGVNPCRFYRPAEYWDGRRPFNSLVQPLYYIIDRVNGPKFARRIRLGWDPKGAERLYGDTDRRVVIGNGRFLRPRVHAQVDPCFVWQNDAARHPHHHIGLAPTAHYIRVYNMDTGYFSWIGLDIYNRCVSTTTEEGMFGVWDKGAFWQLPQIDKAYASEWDRLRNYTHGAGRECDGGTYTIEQGANDVGGRMPKELHSEFIAPTIFALKPDTGTSPASQVYNFSVHMHGYYPPLPTKLTQYGPAPYDTFDIGTRKKRSGTTDTRLPNTWDMLTNGPVPASRHGQIPIALHPVALRVLHIRGTPQPALFAFNAAGEAIACSYMEDILAAAKACQKKSRWGVFAKIVKMAVGPIAQTVGTAFLGPQAGQLIGQAATSITGVISSAVSGDAKGAMAQAMSAASVGLSFYSGGGFALRGLTTIANQAMDKVSQDFESISGITKSVYQDHLAPTAKLMMPGMNSDLMRSVTALSRVDFAVSLIDPRTQRISPSAREILEQAGLPAEAARGFDVGIKRLAADKPVTSADMQYFDAQLKQVAIAGVRAGADDVEMQKSAAGSFVSGGTYGAVNGFDAIVQHQLGGRHPDLEDPTVMDAVRSIYAPPAQFPISTRDSEIPGNQLRSLESEMWRAMGGVTNTGVPYGIGFDDPARLAAGSAARTAATRSVLANTRSGAARQVETAMAKSAAKSAEQIQTRVRGAGGDGSSATLVAAAALAAALAL